MMDDNFNEENEKVVQQYKNLKITIQELIKNISSKLIYGITEEFKEINDSLDNQRKEFKNYFKEEFIKYVEEELHKEIKNGIYKNNKLKEEDKEKLFINVIKAKVEVEGMTELVEEEIARTKDVIYFDVITIILQKIMSYIEYILRLYDFAAESIALDNDNFAELGKLYYIYSKALLPELKDFKLDSHGNDMPSNSVSDYDNHYNHDNNTDIDSSSSRIFLLDEGRKKEEKDSSNKKIKKSNKKLVEHHNTEILTNTKINEIKEVTKGLFVLDKK
uniref:Uncharacterized protein n=2 Tax=Meloidogyne enterolobii TaxID=390850 RepID=A0A6V7XVD9_MELEN|nr:unnamed protein product [Meloidogyne enterolobii]